MKQKKLQLAVLNMYAGQENKGMGCIREIVSRYDNQLEMTEFDVRVTDDVPTIDYDLYISSGGPGNPLEGNGIWDRKFGALLDQVLAFNTQSNSRKKYFFLICHSFQMACAHLKLGDITKRHSTSFGVHPVHKTEAGDLDPILHGLPDPYYAVDSRDWQLIQPNLDHFADHGATILSLEKIRDHVAYERAIMAVRFSDEMVGTQFHPEADSEGMLWYMRQEENKRKIVHTFGEDKYLLMMERLLDPAKVELTQNSILPNFIETAIEKLSIELVNS